MARLEQDLGAGVAEVGDQDHTIPVRRWYLAASLVVLNLLDVLSTKWIISLGGEERNPLLQPIIDHPASVLVLKLGLCVAIGALLLASPRERRVSEVAMGAAVVAYVGVIGWNAAVLIQALGAQG